MQKTKRPLSLLLTFALLISLFAGLTFGVSADGGQKVEAVTSLEDGAAYLITAAYGGKTYALSTDTISSSNAGWRKAEAITLTDGAVTSPADLSAVTWNYTAAGGFTNAGDSTKVLRMATSYIFTTGAATTGCTYNGSTLTGNEKTVQLATQMVGGLATYCFDTAGGTNSGTTVTQTITLYKVVDDADSCAHENTELRDAKAATCGEAGYTGDTWCTDCGKKVSSGQTIPATGEHSFENGVCTVCGAAEPAKVYWAAKAETFEDGKTYLIVTADKTSAMSAAAGTTTGTLKAESVVLDEKAATFSMAVSPDTLLWTAESDGSGFQLKNGGKYLTMSTTTSVAVADSNTNVWNITANGLMSTKSTANSLALINGAFKPGYYSSYKNYLALVYEVSVCNHNWTDTDTETESTCTVPGYVLQRCTVCNGEQKNYKPLAAHSLSDGVCTVCGQILSVRIAEADALEAGKRYIIADSTGLAAMSCENGTGSNADKYRGAVTIQTADGSAAANGEDMSAIIWTAEAADDGGVRFSVTKGAEKFYLAAKSATLYAKATPADGELTSFTYTAEKLFYATGDSSYVLTKGSYGFFTRYNSSTKTVVYEVNPAPASADPFVLEAAKGEDGTITVTVKAAKAFDFAVMELTLRCTYGGAVLQSIESDYADADTVNTETGYAGLYSPDKNNVSVAAGDVLAVYTYTADGDDFRFRLSTGDCYAGTGDNDKLPWSADYTGEDKIDEFPVAELGNPGEDPTGFAVTVEDKSTGAAIAGLDGLKLGETTFTVANDKACVVLVRTGETYTRLTAVPTDEENTYSFTLNVTADTTVVVALKGDVNADGEVNSADRLVVSRACLEQSNSRHYELDAVQAFVADVNGDGEVNSADRLLISRNGLEETNGRHYDFSWDNE